MNSFRTVSERIEIRQDAPNVSSDGGLLLLKKVDEASGLTRRMAECLGEPRKGKLRYARGKMLAQRVYGICQGWEDCNDFDTLREDPLYELVLGQVPAGQSTLSRFENSVNVRSLYRMSETLVEMFVERWQDKPPKRIILDMDATEDPTHGQQEFEFYHGFYGKHCYLPLLVFGSVDDSPMEILAAVLRPGNVHAGKRSAAILKRLAARLKASFPSTEIVFRADAGFALPEVYDVCESLDLSYLISLPRNSRLEGMSEDLMASARQEHDQSGLKARQFGELSYAAGSWSCKRRVLVKAEVMEKGENPRYVVTNLPGDPESLYRLYCQRGDCENRIKEMKLDLLSGRTSCCRFIANCFRLLLHAMAFALMTRVKERLAGTSLANCTMGQIRIKVLKVAAIFQASTRRFLIRLPREHPHAYLLC